MRQPRIGKLRFLDPPVIKRASAADLSYASPQVFARPENVDFGIEGWTRQPSLLAQGVLGVFIFAAGQFPQPVQAQVFKSAPAPTVIAASAVETFVQAGQQQYVDSRGTIFPSTAGVRPGIGVFASASQADPSQIQPQVFKSQPAAPVTASPLAKFFAVQPQEIDLGIEGWVRQPSLRGYSPIQEIVQGFPQADPYQIGGRIFPSVRTPVVVSTGPVPASIYAPQQRDSVQQGSVWESALSAQGAGISYEFRFGGHAVAIYSAETLKSKFFPSVPSAPVVAGQVPKGTFGAPQPDLTQRSAIWQSVVAGQTPPVIKQVSGAPQADPSQLAALVIESQPAATAILGPTLYQTIIAAPQQIDLTLQAYFQQAIQNGAVAEIEAIAGVGGRKRTVKAKRWRVDEPRVEKAAKKVAEYEPRKLEVEGIKAKSEAPNITSLLKEEILAQETELEAIDVAYVALIAMKLMNESEKS